GLSSPFPSDCPARRKRTAIVSLFASTQMFCGPAWLRQKAALAVPPGWGKKRSSTLRGGRRTDARLGHGVVTTYSGSYWIINTLDILQVNIDKTVDFSLIFHMIKIVST
ncbi:hypothetical protein, partial [Aneurinibacillus aneurinilyticus]|uniref:hypothetical protein n=1 Tax=Aneurinibacillus aneurinilyticus TaxID=1391 RepID=UPI001AE056F7